MKLSKILWDSHDLQCETIELKVIFRSHSEKIKRFTTFADTRDKFINSAVHWTWEFYDKFLEVKWAAWHLGRRRRMIESYN